MLEVRDLESWANVYCWPGFWTEKAVVNQSVTRLAGTTDRPAPAQLVNIWIGIGIIFWSICRAISKSSIYKTDLKIFDNQLIKTNV